MDENYVANTVSRNENLLKIQHSDGIIDLLSTNFHSTPDTAFVVETV